MAFSTHQFISIAVGHVWTLSLSDSYQTSQLCCLTGSHHASSSKVSRARFILLFPFRSFDIAIHEVKFHKHTIYDMADYDHLNRNVDRSMPLTLDRRNHILYLDWRLLACDNLFISNMK